MIPDIVLVPLHICVRKTLRLAMKYGKKLVGQKENQKNKKLSISAKYKSKTDICNKEVTELQLQIPGKALSCGNNSSRSNMVINQLDNQKITGSIIICPFFQEWKTE